MKFVCGMGSGLKPIFKKLFVCEVRFWDAVPYARLTDFLKISVCVKFVFGMGSGLEPILKKFFVCEVRFWDAVLVDVVPMGGSQIF